MGRRVDTAFGPLPGCPDCDVIVLSGPPHLCEHGVTATPPIEFTTELKEVNVDALLRLFYPGGGSNL